MISNQEKSTLDIELGFDEMIGVPAHDRRTSPVSQQAFSYDLFYDLVRLFRAKSNTSCSVFCNNQSE
jgi:hypothetical protein